MDIEYFRYKFEDRHDGIITKTKCKLGVRHIQMVYMFLCSLVMGMLRGSNAIAVTAAADITRINDTYIEMHVWSRKIQGSIMSSFFFGYTAMLIPAELYLKQVGDKLVLAAVLLINGALSSAMPTIINKGGWIAACNAQFLAGMSQACVSPVNQNLVSNWLLPKERKVFSFAIYSAIHLGTIIGMIISGMLSEAKLGWELIYYVQAMVVFSMATVWILLTSSVPEKHEAIGDTEKEMIKEAQITYKTKNMIIPWRRIVNTRCFWALACALSSTNVIFTFVLSQLPEILHSVNLSLRVGAALAACPLSAAWLAYTLTSPVGEHVYRYGSYVFDTRYYRRIVNGFGSAGTIIGLALLPHLILTPYQLAVLITILAFIGVQYSGCLDNHRDLTENYSGSLVMMTSLVASAVGATVPLAFGLILGSDGGSEQNNIMYWKLVFWSLAGIYLTLNVVYTVMASSDRADWDGSWDKSDVGHCNDATMTELEDIIKNKTKLRQENIKI